MGVTRDRRLTLSIDGVMVSVGASLVESGTVLMES
jgi:hypothetical protein